MLTRIKTEPGVLNVNRKAIIDFYDACVAEGLTPIRMLGLLGRLIIIAEKLKKPFRKTNRKDIQQIVMKIEQRNISDWTKHDYKVVLKKFYKWLRGTEGYPEEVAWLKTNVKNSKHLLPEELLTDDDVKRLAQIADNPRDKALIFVLYESGCRIGEILTLQIKHLSFEQYGAHLTVSGKTGMRRVLVIGSEPLLRAWLEVHPQRDNPEAPLWVGRGNVGWGEQLDYDSVRMMIARTAKRAGLKKRVKPHAFRHARASHLANKLTEAQLKEMFGWTQSSEMAAVYVHLSGRDVDKAILRLQGIEGDEEEKEQEEKLKITKCPRCGERNAPIAKFCHKCGVPLDLKTALKIEDARSTADQTMNELLTKLVEDPSIQQLLVEKLRETLEPKSQALVFKQ
jgi:integrase/recombinase XerD